MKTPIYRRYQINEHWYLHDGIQCWRCAYSWWDILWNWVKGTKIRYR